MKSEPQPKVHTKEFRKKLRDHILKSVVVLESKGPLTDALKDVKERAEKL